MNNTCPRFSLATKTNAMGLYKDVIISEFFWSNSQFVVYTPNAIV